MPRLRQLYPANYRSGTTIDIEFASVIRYLNSAELGGHTVAELFRRLFDDDGELAANIQFRFDGQDGLWARFGDFESDDDTSGWSLVANAQDLRGAPGISVGNIYGPLIFGRADFVATAGQTVFSYEIDDAASDLMVYQNGVLLPLTDYSYSALTDTMTLAAPAVLNDVISIHSIRADSAEQFDRLNIDITETTTTVPYAHNLSDTFSIYLNGVLQREGEDFTRVGGTSLEFVATLVDGDGVTALRWGGLLEGLPIGIMTTDGFTDMSGLIPWAKLSVSDGQIAQKKVAGLVAALENKKDVFVSTSQPLSGMQQGDLWLNTATAEGVWHGYTDASGWTAISPELTIPSFSPPDGNYYLRVNGTGTDMIWAPIDLSSVIPRTWRGAANGVADLDSTGRVPTEQLPDAFAARTIEASLETVTDGSFHLSTLFLETTRLRGATLQTTAGTCNVQLTIDAVPFGSVYSVSSSRTNDIFTTIVEISSASAGRRLGYTVSSASGATGLAIALAATAAVA